MHFFRCLMAGSLYLAVWILTPPHSNSYLLALSNSGDCSHIWQYDYVMLDITLCCAVRLLESVENLNPRNKTVWHVMVVEHSSKYTGCFTGSLILVEVGLCMVSIRFVVSEKWLTKVGLKGEKRDLLDVGDVYLDHCFQYKIAHYCSVYVCIYVYLQNNNFKILYILGCQKCGEFPPQLRNHHIHTNLFNLVRLYVCEAAVYIFRWQKLWGWADIR